MGLNVYVEENFFVLFGVAESDFPVYNFAAYLKTSPRGRKIAYLSNLNFVSNRSLKGVSVGYSARENFAESLVSKNKKTPVSLGRIPIFTIGKVSASRGL